MTRETLAISKATEAPHSATRLIRRRRQTPRSRTWRGELQVRRRRLQCGPDRKRPIGRSGGSQPADPSYSVSSSASGEFPAHAGVVALWLPRVLIMSGRVDLSQGQARPSDCGAGGL